LNGSTAPRPRTSSEDDVPKKPKTLPFVMVSCEVALNADLSDAAFRLYVILATFADIKGRDGYAGRAAAAKRLGKSKRTMTRLFKELEDKGVISRENNFQALSNGKQRQTTSTWILLDHNATAGALKNRATAYGFEEIVAIEDARKADGREPFDERIADGYGYADT
jgi:hypothetical protein